MRKISLLVAALLLIIIPAQYAFSDEPTIKSSADRHDGKFFGEAAVQVIITNPNTSDSSDDSINIEIEADGASDNFEIPDTSSGSQRFEFFLVHADSQFADGIGNDSTLDPNNTAGFDDPADGYDGIGAPIITFGAGGELDTGDPLYEDTEFTIFHDDLQYSINYEQTFGSLSLDRDSYGSNSFVYITINDQDANLNPFARDRLEFDPDSGPNSDLFELDGGNFMSPAVFEETGSNTAAFEARYQFGSSIEVESKSLSLILFEKSNYEVDLDADENNSNSTDEASFTVENSSGTVTVNEGPAKTWDPVFSADKTDYSKGQTAIITITDPDANLDASKIDSIVVNAASSIESKKFSAFEKQENSGIFELKLGLSESLPDSIIVSDKDRVSIQYTDRYPADYLARKDSGIDPAKTFAFEFTVLTPKTGIETIAVTPASKENADASITITVSLVNNNNSKQPYVALVEIRDTSNTTVYLQYEKGTLGQNAEIEFYWTPEQPGKYMVRTFAISTLVGGEALSPVSTLPITIA
ncbi:MAG: hypothetical protein DA330_01200 [Nitrososphaera sp.]|nr:hypothetical protein [Nitrososphaera sp.]